MTLPPDLVEVVCVRCGTVCTAYLRRATDHDPEPWSGEGGSPEPVLCPECGTELEAEGGAALHVLGAHPSR